MFGCFRKGEANDPDVYVAAITATLARYSEEIITAVTHPTKGLPIEMDWLPSVRQVYQACEVLNQSANAAAKRRRDLDEQLADRKRFDAIDDDERARVSKSIAELAADLKRRLDQANGASERVAELTKQNISIGSGELAAVMTAKGWVKHD
jgi:hypothetical protein